MDDRTADLELRFGALCPPSVIRPIEVSGSIEPVFEMNAATAGLLRSVEHQVGSPVLGDVVATLTFLWLVDENGRIRLALEKLCDEQSLRILTRLRGIGQVIGQKPLGHPLLVGGNAARIGGELYLLRENDGSIWVINNKSGRYSRYPDRNPGHLRSVAEVFASFGIHVHTHYLG